MADAVYPRVHNANACGRRADRTDDSKNPQRTKPTKYCGYPSGSAPTGWTKAPMTLTAPLASGIYIGGGALVVVLIIVVIVLIIR
jgi:hypothetical protein